jgi:hypothetical protein
VRSVRGRSFGCEAGYRLEGDVLPNEDGEGAKLAHAQADERATQNSAVDVLHLWQRSACEHDGAGELVQSACVGW